MAAGYEVVVERGAGLRAFFDDDAYRSAGARLAGSPIDVWMSDLVASVSYPDEATTELINQGLILVGLLEPLDRLREMERLAATGATVFAFELLPRTTRAQAMDALSSQATAAGYRAVLTAAEHSPRFFPMLTTAAGTIPPAQVLVLGAGVAGLQALATAKRLGAKVSGYDVRAAAKEQVESLGVVFVSLGIEAQDESLAGGYARELDAEDRVRQLEGLAPHVARSDVVVTAAGVPGRPAPLLVTAEMVERMKHGSIIVDAAASTGGNCELTRPDEIVEHGGVTVLGPTDLASQVPTHASQMYARNVVAFVEHVSTPEGARLDMEDEIVSGCLVAKEGRLVHTAMAEAIGRGRQ